MSMVSGLPELADAVGAYRRSLDALDSSFKALAPPTPPAPKRRWWQLRAPKPVEPHAPGWIAFNDVRTVPAHEAREAAELVGRAHAALEAMSEARRGVETLLAHSTDEDAVRINELIGTGNYRLGPSGDLVRHISRWPEWLAENERGLRTYANPVSGDLPLAWHTTPQRTIDDWRIAVRELRTAVAGVEAGFELRLAGHQPLRDAMQSASAATRAELQAREAAVAELTSHYRAAVAELEQAPLSATTPAPRSAVTA